MAAYRDEGIEALTDSETLLLELEDMRAQRDAYRLVAQAAIHYCHGQHVELTRLRANHSRVVGEIRAVRQHQADRHSEVA